MMIDDILNNGLMEDNILDALRNSVVIEISNVVNYRYEIEGDFGMNDMPNIAPAFPLMWFEWSIPKQINYKGQISKINIGIEKTGVLWYSYKEESRWGVEVFVFEKYIDDVIEYVGREKIYANELGELDLNEPRHIEYVRSVVNRLVELNQLDPKVAENHVSKSIESNFMLTGIAVSFMHCKNVKSNKIEHPKALQKARLRRKKLPLVEYHILEISPIKKILNEVGQAETQGFKQALHICRGHFKDYSNGSGLFGKYQGLYWWEDQIRGSAKEGIIMKDYKIKTE